MLEQNTFHAARNPYSAKLRRWEDEIKEIEESIRKLPDANLLNASIDMIGKMFFSQQDDSLPEIREKLEKIRSGVQKMIETLSYQGDIDSSSNSDIDEYSKRMVTLLVKSKRLISELSQKDSQEYLRSIADA